MSAVTRFFLVVGCAGVLALEGPRTLAVLAQGWKGPYPLARTGDAPRPREPRTADAPRASGVISGVPISGVPTRIAQARLDASFGLLGLPGR